MMTHTYNKTLSLIAALLFSLISYAQSDINTISLKKGEVLDLLLISQNPDTKAQLDDYFKTAFPIAAEMSFKPIPGYRITASTDGNFKADALSFGKWDNIKLRESFLSSITTKIPDFHERRRAIWSYFGLTYYEMHEDLTFEINKQHHNVVSAYWSSPNESLKTFNKRNLKLIKKHGGRLIVSLTDGVSPFGYYYQPDLLVMTSWDTQEQFEAYHAAAQQLPLDNIQHLNQFVL